MRKNGDRHAKVKLEWFRTSDALIPCCVEHRLRRTRTVTESYKRIPKYGSPPSDMFFVCSTVPARTLSNDLVMQIIVRLQALTNPSVEPQVDS